jgi:hypothetical protein
MDYGGRRRSGPGNGFFPEPRTLNPHRLSRCVPRKAGSADQESKKILDRILKPGKLKGNIGNYEDDAELISIEHREEHPAVVVAGDSRGVACSTGNR